MPTQPKSKPSKPVSSKPDQRKSVAHLSESIADNLAHAKRHGVQLSRARTPGSKQHNAEHLTSHIDAAMEHVVKLRKHLAEHPDIKKEMQDMAKAKRKVKSV